MRVVRVSVVLGVKTTKDDDFVVPSIHALKMISNLKSTISYGLTTAGKVNNYLHTLISLKTA